MNPLRFMVGAVFVLAAGSLTAGQQIFLESFWQNAVASSGVSIWAGGNESSYGPGTSNDAPRSTNGFYLVESAIGQITPQTIGYPQAVADLTGLALTKRSHANGYRYTQSGGGTIAAPAVSWSSTLVFPGGFNPADGTVYGPGVSNVTYFPNDLDSAEYYYRALLRIDPANVAAATNLVSLVADRILPLEFSGSEALAYSAQARLLGLNAALKEIPAIEMARNYYSNACNMFSDFLSNPADAALVEGQNPLLSDAVTNQVAYVLDAYLRSLSGYARASLDDFELRNLTDFRDPNVSDPLPTPLLSDIDGTQRAIQLWLLMASPFQRVPVYTFSEAGTVQSLLREISRLHESILLGRITFIAGATAGAPNNPILRYGEYSTSFVPIFSGIQNPVGDTTFSQASSLASQFASFAQSAESTAKQEIQQAAQLGFDYQKAQNDLQNQYQSELVTLCGYTGTGANGPIIDVFFSALPPGTRETVGSQFAAQLGGAYSPINTGTIYQQWGALQIAETNLLYASVQLSNTFSEMLSKKQVAEAIYSSQVNIANLILSNGQQIAMLDLQKGELQAQQDIQVSQIQADAAETKSETSAMGGFLSGIAGAAAASAGGGGDGGFSSFLGAEVTLANGFTDAAADLQIGQVQAKTARQLAAIDSQIQQITSSERAEVEYAQADQTMLQLSDALNSLRGQANSQAIQIQLAALNVDQERTKLANMLARVAYLIQEWSRSANLLSQNPQLANDFLLDRDAAIRRADEAFLLAQQWAFLAAQGLNYVDNCPADTDASQFVKNVLSTRNAADLLNVLNQMQSAYTLLGAGCQSSLYPYSAHVSLRNDIFQANFTSGEGTNTTYQAFEPVLQNGNIATNAAASQAAWTAFLRQNVRTNRNGRTLVLNFSTSLDPRIVIGHQNQLFNCKNFGSTIDSHSYNNGQIQLKGIQISLTTQGFIFASGSDQTFVVNLAQLGTSVIRINNGYGCNDFSVPRLRCFNFPYFSANVTAAANNLNGSPGTGAFQDRSPANAQWELTLSDIDADNNRNLLDHLDQLTDLEFRFGIRSFTDNSPCAQQGCSQ